MRSKTERASQPQMLQGGSVTHSGMVIFSFQAGCQPDNMQEGFCSLLKTAYSQLDGAAGQQHT